MQLTTFTDFGLRTMMRLAGAPDRAFTTQEIAGEFQISRHHLTKVVRQLAKAGLVDARRGGGGGIRLARPASAISLGEIARTLEGGIAVVECFRADGGACVLTPRCRLKAPLLRAREAFFKELDRTALSRCAYRPLGPLLAGAA